jgi:hypothetical protein
MAALGRLTAVLLMFLPPAGVLACGHGELAGSTRTPQLSKHDEVRNDHEVIDVCSEQDFLDEEKEPGWEVSVLQLKKNESLLSGRKRGSLQIARVVPTGDANRNWCKKKDQKDQEDKDWD